MADLNEFRVVVMGSGAVGKSALTIRLVTNDFLTDYDPTIEDCYQTELLVETEQYKKTCLLQILDTAGQDEFKSMRDEWIREGGDGFLLIYSIVSKNTFDHIIELRQQILRIRENEDVPIVLVGNMCDLDNKRKVEMEDAQLLAQNWGIPFYETSALKDINTKTIFRELIKEIIAKKPQDIKKKRKFCTLL